jgi:hypothetical protein
MVGSTISGFGSDRSDVDMCFVIKGPDSRSDPRNEAIMTLHDLKNHLTSTRSKIHIKIQENPKKLSTYKFNLNRSIYQLYSHQCKSSNITLSSSNE